MPRNTKTGGDATARAEARAKAEASTHAAREDVRHHQNEVDSRRFERPATTSKAADDGKNEVIEFSEDGEKIEVIAMPMEEALEFNEDKLTIVIHEAAERFAEDPVEVAVNGRRCFIKRGQNTLVPRKYVERLLRARKEVFDQNLQAREEQDFNRLTKRPTQMYPLSVLHDPNPKGGSRWIQSIMASD